MTRNKLPRMDLFGECITRACTIKAIERGALNLSQGFPEDEPVSVIREAACEAIEVGPNQYADMRGLRTLRQAVAAYYNGIPGMEWVNPDLHVSITCGTTEAMAASVLATAGPGDEVVIQEPTYENYPPQALLAGATISFLESSPPEWRISEESLARAFQNRPKVLILNGPNNPTGRVYSRDELQSVARYCCECDTTVLVDEIYERMIWDGRAYHHLATFDGMADRVVTISGVSKTYAVTGWRVGWAIAPTETTRALRRVHDFLTAAVPTPLQTASVEALNLPSEYYVGLTKSYERKRELLKGYLDGAGLQYEMPEGAYYFFPSCAGLGFRDSVQFSDALLEEAGVAVVPHTAFFRTANVGVSRFRINFAKREETLRAAGERLVDFCVKRRQRVCRTQ